MRRPPRRRRRFLKGGVPRAVWLLLLALWIAGGCSARKAPESRSSAGDLILIGRENMKERNFERARDAFNRILQEYPESNLRSEALLSLADSFYAAKEFQEAKFQYEKFIQLYPVNPQTPRALYHLGMSDYRRLNTVDRDQTLAEDALKSFRRLVRQFPKNPQTSEALPKIKELEARLAKKQFSIGRFHYANSNYHSAIPRLLRVLKDFPKSPSAAAALYYLADSYAREENYARAKGALERLLREFPNSPYRKKAQRLLKGLPKTVKTGALSR
ncbi:MAG: outer membrane protein assembly factor BamD [Nitrospinota bacterium]